MFLVALISTNPVMPRSLNGRCADCPEITPAALLSLRSRSSCTSQLQIFVLLTFVGLPHPIFPGDWKLQQHTCFTDSDVKTKSGLIDVFAMRSGNFICLPRSSLNSQSWVVVSSWKVKVLGAVWTSPALTKTRLCLTGNLCFLCWIPVQMASATAFCVTSPGFKAAACALVSLTLGPVETLVILHLEHRLDQKLESCCLWLPKLCPLSKPSSEWLHSS